MGSNKKYKYLANAAKSQPPQTNTIRPEATRQLPLIFSFKHFDPKGKKPFICTDGHGKQLLYVVKTLHHFSQVNKDAMKAYPNCHFIPDDQISKHKLATIVLLSPNKRLHQLGRRGTPERIIGYFDTKHLNLFMICLFDLGHNLSG